MRYLEKLPAFLIASLVVFSANAAAGVTPVGLHTEFTPAIRLRVIGTYRTDTFNTKTAEISAPNPATQRLFVVNVDNRGIDVLDEDAPTPSLF